MRITLGRWSLEELNDLISKASAIRGTGERIAFISERFIGTPYVESTLIGDISTPEIPVINLEGMDCFTFIDYIEAMRMSDSFSSFTEMLIRVRYRSGEVSFRKRNHFFTDWREFNKNFIEDVTEQVGGRKTQKARKVLNRKKDGTEFVPGIPPAERDLASIPSGAMDDETSDRLKTGDYIGIYSALEGLDVSHVGIAVRKNDEVYLRHASSVLRAVVDEDFIKYIVDKPGLVVLRPVGA